MNVICYCKYQVHLTTQFQLFFQLSLLSVLHCLPHIQLEILRDKISNLSQILTCAKTSQSLVLIHVVLIIGEGACIMHMYMPENK